MPATHSRRFRLTPRDIAMLESIALARYITAEALEWLHFPTWRERWKAAQAAGKAESYRPAPHLYRRLNHMLDYGLIYRLRRPVERALDTFGREPDVYMISEDGAGLVGAYGSIAFDDVHVTRKRTRSYHNVAHSAMIGQVYAAIKGRVLLRNDNLELHGWQGDHMTRRSYDRIQSQNYAKGKKYAHYELIGIQPDATFEFRQGEKRWRVFVEVDQGTRAVATWKTKMDAYASYVRTPEYKLRYGDVPFVLFAVTTTPTQRLKLMQATAAILGFNAPKHAWFFTENWAAHPEQIGKNWHRIASVASSGISGKPLITTEPHTFF